MVLLFKRVISIRGLGGPSIFSKGIRFLKMLFHKRFNGGFSRYSSNQTQPDRPRIIQSIESDIKTVGRKVRDLAVEIYKFTSKKPILT